jgi:hypothetical protein
MLGRNGHIETDGGAGGCTPRAGKVGPRSNPRPYFFERGNSRIAVRPRRALELGKHNVPRLIAPTPDEAALMILRRYCTWSHSKMGLG